MNMKKTQHLEHGLFPRKKSTVVASLNLFWTNEQCLVVQHLKDPQIQPALWSPPLYFLDMDKKRQEKPPHDHQSIIIIRKTNETSKPWSPEKILYLEIPIQFCIIPGKFGQGFARPRILGIRAKKWGESMWSPSDQKLKQ